MMFLTKSDDLEEAMIRHMILNSIRAIYKKFKGEYGELVICCDGPASWRKTYFPYYKANRKKNREQSTLDWKTIFEIIGKVREELKAFMPYRVIHVNSAEGDDVIGVLAAEWSNELINNNNKMLIVSGDKDFGQLQKFPNVDQYDPVKKVFIKIRDPYKTLKEHIIRGDVGDGIPNFLSNDNCLVVGERQKSIMAAKVLDWLDKEASEFCDENMFRNFKRNETLIDLSKIPLELKNNILAAFENDNGRNRSKIMKYFIENKLSNLMDVISDF